MLSDGAILNVGRQRGKLVVVVRSRFSVTGRNVLVTGRNALSGRLMRNNDLEWKKGLVSVE